MEFKRFDHIFYGSICFFFVCKFNMCSKNKLSIELEPDTQTIDWTCDASNSNKEPNELKGKTERKIK